MLKLVVTRVRVLIFDPIREALFAAWILSSSCFKLFFCLPVRSADGKATRRGVALTMIALAQRDECFVKRSKSTTKARSHPASKPTIKQLLKLDPFLQRVLRTR